MYDMEVQILHRTLNGEYRYQSILSILFKRSPGETRRVFKLFDLLNLPNSETPLNAQLKESLNVLDFIFEEENDVAEGVPFSYYKYMGSNT